MAHTRNAQLLTTFWQLGSHRDTTKQNAEQRCKNERRKIQWNLHTATQHKKKQKISTGLLINRNPST